MTFYKTVVVSSILALAASFLPGAESSPYTIGDDRVRKLDITPVLGRGYSIMTDKYHSNCLNVRDTTPPSYNYDYSFYEFSSAIQAESSMNSELKSAYSYQYVKGSYQSTYKSQYESSSQSTTQSESNRHFIVAVMSLERYYSSVREEVSPLTDDATTLLNRGDWVGFFKACGPNYVRGIRRRQEVTAVFWFNSSSRSVAQRYSAGLQTSSTRKSTSGWWWWKSTSSSQSSFDYSFSYDSTFSEINESLYIKILGYGVGLNDKDSETLVASSLDEYNNVMKFAFKAFTQTKESYHIGMVHGIEIVPWSDNSSFQVEAGLSNDDIVIPLPRSLIPKASVPCRKEGVPSATDGDTYAPSAGPSAAPSDYPTGQMVVRDCCKNPEYVKDKNDYCCEPSQLYDPVNKEYNEDDPLTKICRPTRPLDRALVKENMSGNGEFVARLDSAMRYRLVQLSTMEKCISAANSYPDDYNHNIMIPQATVEYNEVIDVSYTLLHLKVALDPLQDFGLIKHMAYELDEWIDMFYSPCLAALFGTNVGLSSDTDTRLFMAYPWHSHDECMRLSCLAPNMRWDRKLGGCTPSLISGNKSGNYDGSSECAKDPEASDDTTCKHDETKLKNYTKSSKKCWRNSGLSSFTVDYFMNHFCMPQISGTIAPEDKRASEQRTCDGSTLSPTQSPVDRRRLSEVELDAGDLDGYEEDESGIMNLKFRNLD